MAKPIEALTGADAAAFRSAIKPHVKAVIDEDSPFIPVGDFEGESGGSFVGVSGGATFASNLISSERYL